MPRTRDALDVLAANVRLAQAELPVPLALEHVAALLEWPAPELDEAAFLTELLERTARCCSWTWPTCTPTPATTAATRSASSTPCRWSGSPTCTWPAGSSAKACTTTPRPPDPPGVLDLVAELCARRDPPGVMLERDDATPTRAGAGRRAGRPSPPPPAPAPPAVTASRRVRAGGLPRSAGARPEGVPRRSASGWPPSRRPWCGRWWAAAGPGGFDPDRVGRPRPRSPASGPARSPAPGGAGRELGEDFTGRFLAFAARRPPTPGGALADGLAFTRALAGQGRLPPNARAEAMLAAAHLSPRPVRLAATIAGPPRRLVITVRAPTLGDHWLSIPLG